jgi:hypothetical protein
VTTMPLRRPLSAMLLLAGIGAVFGCGNPTGLDSIQVSPPSQSLIIGQTAQLTATGTFGNASHPSTQNVTNSVTWASGTPSVATVGSTGLVIAVGAGTTVITASATAFNGPISSSATISVAVSGNGSTSTGGGGISGTEPLLSINIVPGGTTVSNKGMTGQYLAFGTYSTPPYVRDLTNQVTWISLAPEVASIESGGASGQVGGLATAMGYTGNSPIYAEASNPDGTVVLSNAQSFTCKDSGTNVCEQAVAHPQFATITVFHAGSNTTTWEISAPSGTGTPNLIHCGPASPNGSVCTGVYETGSTVTLTASPTGAGFGGWSSGDGAPGIGCVPVPTPNPPFPATCTVTLTGDTSVGAIFY